MDERGGSGYHSESHGGAGELFCMTECRLQNLEAKLCRGNWSYEYTKRSFKRDLSLVYDVLKMKRSLSENLCEAL